MSLARRDKACVPRFHTKTLFDNREVALVVTMGDSNPSTADPTLGMLKRALSYVGIEIAATVLAPGVGALGEAAAHSELMKKAREAGRTVVTS